MWLIAYSLNLLWPDCGTLANPTNGEVKMPDGTLFGATAVYTCNSGYSTKDYYKRTCLSNGTWSSNAPTCKSSSRFFDNIYYFTVLYLY
jgi:hypothetical protein